MTLSLQSIAASVGGRVVRAGRPHVAAPCPGKKKHDRSLHVFINGDDIGVHVFRDGVDPIAIKDHVRHACGMPAWQANARHRTRGKLSPSAVPFAIRNHFFGETLAICRLRQRITFEEFALLINDLRLRGDVRDALKYMREFRFGPAELERAMRLKTRHYKADERARKFQLTYAERQHLGLRRTGSIDVDKEGRERARRERQNAARRAKRAAARLAGANRKDAKLQKVEEERKEEEETNVRREDVVADAHEVKREQDCSGMKRAGKRTRAGRKPGAVTTVACEIAERAADMPAETSNVQDPADDAGLLRLIGGSRSDTWNNLLANQALRSLWVGNSDEETKEKQYNATLTALMAIQPRDELESMIAAQLLAAHNAAMECYRRAMIQEQTFQGRDQNLAYANKLSRTYTTLLEALNRYRGKGQQKVTVEHVHVHAGGQAVVGSVEVPAGGGAHGKSKEQAHAKQIANARQLPLRSAHPERDTVPIGSDV